MGFQDNPGTKTKIHQENVPLYVNMDNTGRDSNKNNLEDNRDINSENSDKKYATKRQNHETSQHSIDRTDESNTDDSSRKETPLQKSCPGKNPARNRDKAGAFKNRNLTKQSSLSTLPTQSSTQDDPSFLPPLEGTNSTRNRLRRSSSDVTASQTQQRRQSYWALLKDKMDSQPHMDDQSKWAIVMRMRDTMTNRFTMRFQKWWDNEIVKKREAELRKKSIQLCLAEKIQLQRHQVSTEENSEDSCSDMEDEQSSVRPRSFQSSAYYRPYSECSHSYEESVERLHSNLGSPIPSTPDHCFRPPSSSLSTRPTSVESAASTTQYLTQEETKYDRRHSPRPNSVQRMLIVSENRQSRRREATKSRLSSRTQLHQSPLLSPQPVARSRNRTSISSNHERTNSTQLKEREEIIKGHILSNRTSISSNHERTNSTQLRQRVEIIKETSVEKSRVHIVVNEHEESEVQNKTYLSSDSTASSEEDDGSHSEHGHSKTHRVVLVHQTMNHKQVNRSNTIKEENIRTTSGNTKEYRDSTKTHSRNETSVLDKKETNTSTENSKLRTEDGEDIKSNKQTTKQEITEKSEENTSTKASTSKNEAKAQRRRKSTASSKQHVDMATIGATTTAAAVAHGSRRRDSSIEYRRSLSSESDFRSVSIDVLSNDESETMSITRETAMQYEDNVSSHSVFVSDARVHHQTETEVTETIQENHQETKEEVSDQAENKSESDVTSESKQMKDTEKNKEGISEKKETKSTEEQSDESKVEDKTQNEDKIKTEEQTENSSNHEEKAESRSDEKVDDETVTGSKSIEKDNTDVASNKDETKSNEQDVREERVEPEERVVSPVKSPVADTEAENIPAEGATKEEPNETEDSAKADSQTHPMDVEKVEEDVKEDVEEDTQSTKSQNTHNSPQPQTEETRQEEEPKDEAVEETRAPSAQEQISEPTEEPEQPEAVEDSEKEPDPATDSPVPSPDVLPVVAAAAAQTNAEASRPEDISKEQERTDPEQKPDEQEPQKTDVKEPEESAPQPEDNAPEKQEEQPQTKEDEAAPEDQAEVKEPDRPQSNIDDPPPEENTPDDPEPPDEEDVEVQKEPPPARKEDPKLQELENLLDNNLNSLLNPGGEAKPVNMSEDEINNYLYGDKAQEIDRFLNDV